MAGRGSILCGWAGNASANHFSARLPCKHAIYKSWGKAWTRPGLPRIPVPSNEFGAVGFYLPRFQNSSDLVSLGEQGHLSVRDGIARGETNQIAFVGAASAHRHRVRRVTSTVTRPWGKGLASARPFGLTSPSFEDPGDASHLSSSKQSPKEPRTGGQSLGEEKDVVWSLGWAV